MRSLTKFFQLDKSGLTDMNFRNQCKLNASIFLSADPGVIVVKAIKGNKWAFLLWKLCYTVLYNLKIWQIILTSQNVAKMMWTYFLRIARKGLSSMFDCFLTVKAYQGQSITIFVLRFLLIQSYTYETIWCLLRHQTTFIISSKLQIKYPWDPKVSTGPILYY